ncbi:MAG: hypothetical protein AB7S41_11405 [Parvibaculaceae bacterium]
MVKIWNHQSAHTYGVLDPLMAERRDTKFVPGSLSDAVNMICYPQGGYYDRGGTQRRHVLRRAIVPVEITAGLVTAGNGGTIANLVDPDLTTAFTTSAVNANPFVVFSINFGTPRAIACFDVLGFKAGTAAAAQAVVLQYLVDATWHTFAGPFDLRTVERSRRFARAPQAGMVTAQQWRLAILGGAGPGAITVGSIRAFTETATLSAKKGFRYNREGDSGQRFGLEATDGNLDIFKDGVWQAAVHFPATSDMLARVKHAPAYDTVLFFHQDMKPQRLVRQGSDTEWNFDDAPFMNVPIVDYGGVYVNGVNAKQRITLYSIGALEDFELQLEGEITAAITRDGTASVTSASIQAALEALPNVEAGLTVTHISGTTWEVEFTGGDNASREWITMEGRALNDDGIVTVRTTQKGKLAGEDVMSAARGWPAVGQYAQGRLVLAGFKSRPGSYLWSITGDPFNLDVTRQGAAAAILADIDDDDESTVRDIQIGRTIIFFTDSRVWYQAASKIDATETPDLRKADVPGIDPGVRPISSENAVYYVERGGKAIRQLAYSELEGNYVADNAGVLSSILIDQPVAIALRRATGRNAADLILIVNEDGSLVTITSMRTQDVSGFMPHRTTQGFFRDVYVTGTDQVWFGCERTVAGATRIVSEEMDDLAFLDSATGFAFDPPQTTLTGLSAYNGQTLHVMADGEFKGTYEVAGGTITLEEPVESASAGYWRAPFATDVAFFLEDETRRPAPKLKRVLAVTLSLLDTTSVAIAANGGAAYDVPLMNFNDESTPLDSTPQDRPFSGRKRLEGFRGWTQEGKVTVTQLQPGRLKVRALAKEIAA